MKKLTRQTCISYFLVQRYDECFIYTNLFNQQPYIFSQPFDL